MQSSSTSRNKRTTDRGSINLADVVQAIRTIKLGNKTVRAAAQTYNLPRSTLRRYLAKVTTEYEDISNISDEELQETIKRLGTYAACAVKQVFSSEEEQILVGYIQQCCELYYDLSINELRELAYLFAKRINANYPASWDENGMCGRDWYYGFMRRHQNQNLTLRKPGQHIKFNAEFVELLFRNLDASGRAATDVVKQSVAAQSQVQHEHLTDEDKNFCIVCLEAMSRYLMNSNNSIECIKCHRAVHLKCVKVKQSYYTCQNCQSG